MSKTFSGKIEYFVSMSVFPRFILCYRVFGCLSAMGVQKHYKKRFAKTRVETFVQNNRQKNLNPFFSRFSFITFKGVSRGGDFKNKTKNRGKSDQPWYFFGIRGTNHVGVRHLFLRAACSRVHRVSLSPAAGTRDPPSCLRPGIGYISAACACYEA
jgi:hypothetical protein